MTSEILLSILSPAELDDLLKLLLSNTWHSFSNSDFPVQRKDVGQNHSLGNKNFNRSVLLKKKKKAQFSDTLF